MDVVTLLEANFPFTSTASKTQTPPEPSPTEPSSSSKGDPRSESDDTETRKVTDPSTVQHHISAKPTRHFPLRPQMSHRHSSTDARHSASSVQKSTPPASASVDSMESTSASGVPHCSRCGLLRVRSALHPNHYTCHAPFVTGSPDHDLTSHLGSESLGQSSRLVVEDGRSFD